MISRAAVKRAAVFLHRWLGVSLCILFLLWFPSGIGMMYWQFPSVTAADRLDHSPPLASPSVRLSPADAYARLGLANPPAQIRLNSFDGRPVYRFGDRNRESLVYADTGEQQIDVSDQMRLRIASAWVGLSASLAIVTAVTDVDQWTVAGGLRNLRPLWKYSWPTGEEVYVAGATGEVVQYTTTASRIGAYLGPIPHWFYFTPIRKHQVAWSQIVIWASGAGTVASLLGMIVGAWMYSPQKRYRYAGGPTGIPYRGQKRWHMLFGLVFGLGAVTWAFSGMLSMEPFPRQAGGANEGVSRMVQALRGRAPMEAFAAKSPAAALLQLRPEDVKELEFASFAGEAVYIARLSDGGTRIVPVTGEPMGAFDHERILEIVRRTVAPVGVTEATLLKEYDTYYIDRRGELPLPVLRVRTGGPEEVQYHVDPRTARVVSTYGSGSWVNRWLYHGLHSLDFPWLYNYRPLWDIVVILFMVGGTALCATSVILAWRVVIRKRRREDLALERQ